MKATAEFIRQGGGEFVLPVKENRKALFDALDALPCHQVPIAHSATDRGRITTRTVQVLPAPEDLPFPHVSQVYLIERHVSEGMTVSSPSLPARTRIVRRRAGSVATLSPLVAGPKRTTSSSRTAGRAALIHPRTGLLFLRTIPLLRSLWYICTPTLLRRW